MSTEESEKRLSREDLYELVWTEPMQALGPKFGMSDVGLKKACRRLRIPTPGRGYWAMKAAGRAPRRAPLPKLPASVPPSQQTITFGRPAKPTPKEKVEATGPVAEQERFEVLPENRIAVAEVLTDPHKLVQASVQLLRNARPDQQHRLVPRGKKCLAVAVTLATADRAMAVYDAMLKACDLRGWAVRVAEGEKGSSTAVTVAGEQVSLLIEERVDRVERKPDPKEKRIYWGREYDYIPTGRLTVRLVAPYLGGVRQTWSDGAKQRVEDCLNGVMVGLVAASEFIKAQRLELEARHREYVAAEERRRELERRRQAEEARIRALDSDLVAWRKANVVRQYAAAMRQSAEVAGLLDEESPMAAWLAWVDAYADRIDPTNGTPSTPADPQPHAWQSAGLSSSARPIW